jgi:pantothenate synthetase
MPQYLKLVAFLVLALAMGLSAVSAAVRQDEPNAADAEELELVSELNGRPVLVAVAAQVGGARLIDNVLIAPNREA